MREELEFGESEDEGKDPASESSPSFGSSPPDDDVAQTEPEGAPSPSPADDEEPGPLGGAGPRFNPRPPPASVPSGFVRPSDPGRPHTSVPPPPPPRSSLAAGAPPSPPTAPPTTTPPPRPATPEPEPSLSTPTPAPVPPAAPAATPPAPVPPAPTPQVTPDPPPTAPPAPPPPVPAAEPRPPRQHFSPGPPPPARPASPPRPSPGRPPRLRTEAQPLAATRPAPAPTPVRGRGPRRNRQVIRHFDLWSVLRFSLLFYLCMFLILLVAGIVLWLVATVTGVRGNIENFVSDLIASKFHFLGLQLLRAAAIGGLLLVIIGSAMNMLMALLYNLISDVVGGIEISVLEDDRPNSTVV